MKKFTRISIFLLLLMLIIAGCRPVTELGITRETAEEGITGRPVAPMQPYINAYSVILYFPGANYVRDFSTEYGLYIYFAQPGKILKYGLQNPYPLVSTTNVDVNYVDYIGNTWGLAGASNADRRFYVNLTEQVFYYIAYPADLVEVHGLALYIADNLYHFVVSATIANRPSRYLVDYLYQNGILYKRAAAAIPADDYLDITTIGGSVFGCNATGYPRIWKKNSVAAAQVYETLPAGYNCHGFYSGYTGKNEILNFSRTDYSYMGSSNEWGFYNLNYFANTNNVELTFIPLSGITF